MTTAPWGCPSAVQGDVVLILNSKSVSDIVFVSWSIIRDNVKQQNGQSDYENSFNINFNKAIYVTTKGGLIKEV